MIPLVEKMSSFMAELLVFTSFGSHLDNRQNFCFISQEGGKDGIPRKGFDLKKRRGQEGNLLLLKSVKYRLQGYQEDEFGH